jgi:glycosyltransferase involved in cell wall biosynthesis
MLLRAWSRALQKGSITNLHLLLVGSGVNQYLSCEKELRNYVDENRLKDFVTFTGNVRNVQEYLQASDFFTLPSESEAMPNALIEAMAVGLPVIATAAGGIKDIIETGQNGIMIEINDEDALVESILTLIHEPDEANRLGKAGRKTVIKRFSLEMAADRYEAFFKKLLNDGQFGFEYTN